MQCLVGGFLHWHGGGGRAAVTAMMAAKPADDGPDLGGQAIAMTLPSRNLRASLGEGVATPTSNTVLAR